MINGKKKALNGSNQSIRTVEDSLGSINHEAYLIASNRHLSDKEIRG